MSKDLGTAIDAINQNTTNIVLAKELTRQRELELNIKKIELNIQLAKVKKSQYEIEKAKLYLNLNNDNQNNSNHTLILDDCMNIKSYAKDIAEIEKENARIKDLPVPPMFDADIHDVWITYETWIAPLFHGFSYKDIYSYYPRIQWSKHFSQGDIVAIKNRYYKTRPFLDYIDSFPECERKQVCDKLNIITKHFPFVTSSVFVKYYIYSLKHPPTSCTFDIEILKNLFIQHELPLP